MSTLAPEGDDDHHTCQWAALLYGPHPSTSQDPNSPDFAGVPTPTPGSSAWREGNHGPEQGPRPDLFSQAALTIVIEATGNLPSETSAS